MRPLIGQPILTKHFCHADNIIPMATVKNEANAKETPGISIFLDLTQRNILWWVFSNDTVILTILFCEYCIFKVHTSFYAEHGFPTVSTGRGHFGQNSIKLHENWKINIFGGNIMGEVGQVNR